MAKKRKSTRRKKSAGGHKEWFIASHRKEGKKLSPRERDAIISLTDAKGGSVEGWIERAKKVLADNGCKIAAAAAKAPRKKRRK